jgi:hypothetical protein
VLAATFSAGSSILPAATIELGPGEEKENSVTKPTLQAVELGTETDDAPAPDPFELANLRLSQAFVKTAGVKQLLTTVPVRKPYPQEFVRVHPNPDYRENFPIIELKGETREEYLITSQLVPELTGELVTKTLFTAITRQGTVFLWPVRLPDADGKQNEWWRSMREAAELAMERWLRIKANMGLGAYEIFVAEGSIHEPIWPDINYQELIRLAFRDRLITSLDHPVIKRLRGLA